MTNLLFHGSVRTTFLATAFALFVLSQTVLAEVSVPDESDGEQALGISSNFGKWTDGTITWVYNSTNAPAGWTDDTDTVARFQAAIDEWNGLCDLNFVFGGVDDTADLDNKTNGIVVFEWGSLGGAAGRAGPVSTSATIVSLGRWNYFDGSLEMDSGVFEFTGGASDEQERNRVAFHATTVHELGHLIGLGHSDRPDSIMYANPYNSITHLMDDDIQACRAMYGYSDVNDPKDLYQPPAGPGGNYDILYLAAFSDITTPITQDDGTVLETDSLGVRWQKTSGAFPATLTQAVVDPSGNLATIASTEITQASGGAFGIASFRRLREFPGQWTVYVYDGLGLINALTIDVTTSLPVVNEAPTAVLTFSENPATRFVNLNGDVTGDAESDLASIFWHIPGTAPFEVPLNASSGSDNQTVSFGDDSDHEIFMEVRDNATRYDGTNPNSGPAGTGFQRLFRYASSGLNNGPDLDGDNSSDILWRNLGDGQNWLYTMAGNLQKTSSGINTISDTNWDVVGTGDHNGDGKSDILWRHRADGRNWMYLMNGAGIASSLAVNTISDTQWKVVGSGDYNGDGNADVLWRHDGDGRNWMYLMNGASIASSLPVNTISDTQWKVVGNGDYNGDGNADILWRHDGDGRNWMYLMNGASISSSLAVNTISDAQWKVVGNGDYNSDGESDILWRHAGDGRNWMYLMNGASIDSSLAVNTISDSQWEVVGNGDYNGDGNSDILWRHSGDGRNWMYQMNGASISKSIAINTISDQQWVVVGGD